MDTSNITTDAPTRPDAPPRSTGTHGGRRRIHRKLDLTSEPAALQPRSDPAELLVVFHDGHGVPSDSYDFASLGLPADIAAVLSDAAKAFLTPLEPQTRGSYWKTFRNFSRFVLAAQPPINSVRDVNSKTFQEYRDWLLQQTHHRTNMPLVERTIAGHLIRLSKILSSGKLLPGNRLPCEIALPAYVMPNRTPTPPQRHLDEPQLKTLLSECYYEIRETRRLFELGQAMLAAPAPLPGQDPNLHRIVHAIDELLADSYPSYERLTAKRISVRFLTTHGRIPHSISYLCATPDTLTPIYIALLVQLAGNPEPVLNISRKCVRPHPLEDHHEIVEWEKPRAGRIRRHIQRRTFDSRKKQSAPNLVTLALELTHPLLCRAASRHRTRLFLVPHPRKKCFAPLTMKMLELSIPRFLARANCRIKEFNLSHPDEPKPYIDALTPQQLRPSAAQAHHQSSGGDIRKTQSVLNHASAKTTIDYVESRSTKELRNQVIATLQDTFINHIQDAESTSTFQGTQSAPQALAPASACIGHLCRKPLLPPDPDDSRKRPRLCPNFHRCTHCPHLIVPIDIPHLARLLQIRQLYDQARARLHPDRWQIFHEPTSLCLDEILANFPQTLFPEALTLTNELPPLSDLE